MERSRLVNGRFLHRMDGWTVSGAVYSAGDGGEHYGVAVLSSGDWIEQSFAVTGNRVDTLHVALKSSGEIDGSDVDIGIVDGDGNTVTTLNPKIGPADVWVEYEFLVGLGQGTTYTLRITNNQAEDVSVDDVWLWFVPMTRYQVGSWVHDKLGRLATDRSLSFVADGVKSEGSYTFAIDSGLRQVGATNPYTGKPDIRYVDIGDVDTVVDVARREVLEMLRADYAVEVDIAEGPHRESLSQIGKSIDTMIEEGGSSGGRVVMRRLTHG